MTASSLRAAHMRRTWFVILSLLVLCFAPTARADWRPSGAVSAHALFHGDDLGGAAVVDLVAPLGPFRLGVAGGVAALSSRDAEESRVFMPLGLSAGFGLQTPSRIGFGVKARAGAWAGATDAGLRMGAWLATGAFIEYALDASVSLAAGVDGWFLFGHGNTTIVSPFVSLIWTLDASSDAESRTER